MRIPKTSSPKKGESFDALVVGSGIAGIVTSALLLKAGRKVLLCERLAAIGGRFSPENRTGLKLGSGFSFGDCAVWKRLYEHLGLEWKSNIPTHGNALSFESKGWSAAEDLPAWEAFWARSCEEFPEGGYYGILETLLDFCQKSGRFTLALECPVTSLVATGTKLTHAILGSEVQVEVAEVFWASDFRQLMEVLHGEAVPQPGPERVSWLKPYSKSAPNAGVVLEFCHKELISEFTETLLIPFSTSEKEPRYLAGAFVSNRDPSYGTQAYSSWIFPLSESEWGDNHETMKKIRSARRLLEKAFPGFETKTEFERVLVLNSTVSPLSKKKGSWDSPMAGLKLVADWANPQGATPDTTVETLLENLV